MQMDVDTEAFVSNPLNAFLLIKHLSLDTHQILQYVNDASDEFSRNTNDLILDIEELTGSVEAIDRLQTTYNLKTEDLANGIIDSDSYNMSLSVRDLFTIGTELQISEKHSRAVEYFIEALKRNQNLNDFLEANDNEILTELLISYEILRDYEKTIIVIDELLKLDSKKADEILSLKNLRKTYEEILKMEGNEKFVEPKESSEEKVTRQLCNYQIFQSAAEKSKLCCKFESKSHFSKLSPFKVEEVHLDPLIVVYHEVVSNDEIEVLKKIAKPRFELPKESLSLSTDRTFKIAWLDDESHEIVSRLSKRVEHMTGLSVETAENLQIQQYSMGGFYKSHFYFDENLKTHNDGDRVATVLFYVSFNFLIFNQTKSIFGLFTKEVL